MAQIKRSKKLHIGAPNVKSSDSRSPMFGRERKNFINNMQHAVAFGTTGIDADGNIIETHTFVPKSHKKPKGAPGIVSGQPVNYHINPKKKYTPMDEQYVYERYEIVCGKGTLVFEADITHKTVIWQYAIQFKERMMSLLAEVIAKHDISIEGEVTFKVILCGTAIKGRVGTDNLPVYGEYSTNYGLELIGWAGARFGQFIEDEREATVLDTLRDLFVNGLGVTEANWACSVSKTVRNALKARAQ